MSATSFPGLPFDLTFTGKGAWIGAWTERKLRVAVGGTEEAPAAALLATLVDVIARWPAHEQVIAAHVRGLAPDHHVPLDPRLRILSALPLPGARSCVMARRV